MATRIHDAETIPLRAPKVRAVGRGRLVIAALLLGLSVLAVYLLAAPGALNGLDGRSMLQVTSSMVERGDVTTSPAYGVPGRYGHSYSKYGPGQSVAALPLYLAGRALEPSVAPSYRPELPLMLASFLPAIVTAITVILLVLTAVELGATPRGAVVLGLIYALATPAAVYAIQYFSEPLTGCMVLAAVYLLIRDRDRATLWRPLLAGVAFSFAVATRLETLLLAPPLALYAVLPRQQRVTRGTAFGFPLLAALAGLAVYDQLRFGAPTATGYSEGDIYAYRDTHPAHSLSSLLQGIYGLLLSPGKGLVEYAPPVLLAPLGAALLWMRRRAETALLLTLFLIELLGHANVLIRWLGGWSWGPRFLIVALPLALLLLAPLFGNVGRTWRRVRGILAVLAVLGLLVQAPALVLDEPHTYIYSLQPQYCTATVHGLHCTMSDLERLESDYVNRPALSPIVGSWRMLWTPDSWRLSRDVTPMQVARTGVTTAPHTWWRLLQLQGAPPGALAALCAGLALAAIALLLAALRLSGPPGRSSPTPAAEGRHDRVAGDLSEAEF
jgi:hypothetical protein